jgi:hypothetical protein
MSAKGIAWTAAGLAAVAVTARVVAAARKRPRDPLTRSVARNEARVDAIAALLAGIYQAEGIPVPAALSPAPSALARIRHLHLIRSAG